MAFKIGLTGGIASGKSTVAQLFSKLGVPIIDADVIARQLLNKDTEYYHQVIALFGKEILFDNDEINRAKLRHRIFSSAQDKQQLEQLLHPVIRKKQLDTASESQAPYCICVVPLLFETGMDKLVDRILVIDSSMHEQLERLMQRDHITPDLAKSMIAQQCSQQHRLAHADDIIHNSSTVDSLENQTLRLHQQYLTIINGS